MTHKIDPTTWRIAVRQADALIRLRADTARSSVRQEELNEAADFVWEKLQSPPKTDEEAYALDKWMEMNWTAKSRESEETGAGV